MDPTIVNLISALLGFSAGFVSGRKTAKPKNALVHIPPTIPESTPGPEIDPDIFELDGLEDFLDGLSDEELEALRLLLESESIHDLPIQPPVIQTVTRYVYRTRKVEVAVSSKIEAEKEEPLELRNFQDEVRIFASKHDDAMFIYPTGTGKTVMITAIIADLIKNNPGYSNIVVFSPKIFLANQMLLRVRRELDKQGIVAKYSLINSKVLTSEDRVYMRKALRLSDDASRDELIEPTTNANVLANSARLAKRNNVPHIISSTYHSYGVINDAGIKLLARFFDEAHHTAADPNNEKDNHSGVVVNMTSKRAYGFSATHREHEDAIISYNVLSKTVKEMVNLGEMIPPRLSEVIAENPVPSQNVDGRVMEDAFTEWRRLSNTAGVRMIVGARRKQAGVSHIQQLSDYANKMREIRPHLKVFNTSAEHGCYINGEEVSDLRFQFELYDHCRDDRNEAIIIHYDILTEGYDVPTLTGVLFFGKASRRRAEQMIGRVLRLHDYDRGRLYDESISPGDVNKMVKPFGMVAYAYYGEQGEDVRSSVVDVVQEMRALEEIKQTFVYSPQSQENVKKRRQSKERGVPDTDLVVWDEYLGNVEQKHEAVNLATEIFDAEAAANGIDIDAYLDKLEKQKDLVEF